MQPDELRVRIHAQHAFALSVGRETTAIDHGPAWSLLSVAWESTPDAFETELWIDGCLPENGNREPYTADLVRFLDPPIVAAVVEDNRSSADAWTGALSELGIDPACWLWPDAACTFRGTLRI